MKIWYVGVEPYKSRYTLQLTDWWLEGFKRNQQDFSNVEGKLLNTSAEIKTGAVLDVHMRSFYALSQMQILVQALHRGKIRKGDWIYIEDMFHPGIEALFYSLSQIAPDARPFVGTKCHAQTIDPDDFVHYQGMFKWMCKYEQMVIESGFITCLFIASSEMLNHMAIAGWRQHVSVAVVGHPMNERMMLDMLDVPVREFNSRPLRVTFASRLVAEKQPDFFIRLAELVRTKTSMPVEFSFVTGSSQVPEIILRWALCAPSWRFVFSNCSKTAYYQLLNRSRVLFNSALQDWTSYVQLEGAVMGCNLLFPAYRSFPESLNNNRELLYVPWSLEDAADKLIALLQTYNKDSRYPIERNEGAIDRSIGIMNSISISGSSPYLIHPGDHKPGLAVTY